MNDKIAPITNTAFTHGENKPIEFLDSLRKDIFHVHMHVFPRFEGDSFKIDANWTEKPSRTELDQIANQINIAYDRLWKSSLNGGT